MHKWTIKAAMVVAVFAITLGSAGKAAAQADWPCFRGPNHDDISADKGLLKAGPADTTKPAP
jgi:hypothetical protein